MILKAVFSLFCFAILSVSACSQSVNLTISFSGIMEGKGQILLKVLDQHGNLKASGSVSAQKDPTMYTLQLPAGKFAVQAFYDENSNHKLDKNLIGVPKEKYGFSNNARGIFGPPDLSAQLIDLPNDKSISIKLY